MENSEILKAIKDMIATLKEAGATWEETLPILQTFQIASAIPSNEKLLEYWKEHKG